MSSILGHTITIGSPLIINPSTPSSTLQAAHAPRLYRLVARGRLALCVKWLRYCAVKKRVTTNDKTANYQALTT